MNMQLGVPKEIMAGERRVSATPAAVTAYRQMGFDVLIESGAGEGFFTSDDDYRDVGAEIVEGPQELYARADVVLKVKQPMLNRALGIHEVEMMKRGATLVAFLHPASPDSREMVGMLAAKRITSLTLDSLPRTLSHAQPMDALTSMSTVTGYRSVVLAAAAFPRFIPTIGTAVGMNPPAKFLVLGAGVVGLQAIATARRLGAATTAFDIRPDAREQAASLGAKVGEFDVPPELAVGEGGYSKALSAEWLQKEREALLHVVQGADVVIASALVPHERAPVLITESMVRQMRRGSVIVDVAIDQGGNCSLTRPGETVVAHGVTISGLQNIPGGLPVDATRLFAQNLQNFMKHLFPDGAGSPSLSDELARSMLVTTEGEIVHQGTLKALREVESSPAPAA